MTAAAAIDQAAFRHALGHFATGVAVVTALDGGRPHGLTVSSFSSLSLEPPLVQWAVRDASHGRAVFTAAELFAVNILADDQAAVSRDFCRPIDRFATVAVEPGIGGLPLIDGCLGWIECAREQAIGVGDHHIIVGRVLRARLFERTPLVHWRGAFAMLNQSGAARVA